MCFLKPTKIDLPNLTHTCALPRHMAEKRGFPVASGLSSASCDPYLRLIQGHDVTRTASTKENPLATAAVRVLATQGETTN